MDLRSHYPYWLLEHGLIRSYPSLTKNATADVVVMGAGISGALVAWNLTRAGYHVIIVDRRHIGMGSTVACTSLLQYEIDIPLHQLIGLIGEKAAVSSYQCCLAAINKLEKICSGLNDTTLFNRRPSFQFASYKNDLPGLKKEFDCRKKAGFSVEFLDQREVKEHYFFSKPGGLLSADAAETDAYRLTHQLLWASSMNGADIYDHTEISDIHHTSRGVKLNIAGEKAVINSKFLVIACGYESQKYISRKVQDLQSTFAIASEPIEEKEHWYRNSLIWETAKPYIYLRKTSDNRIIIGGKDLPFSDPIKRDSVLPSRVRKLESSFEKLFPEIHFKTDFSWAGSFAHTKDGLPYIGSVPERPRTYFSLGFGGNGINFSITAAEIITDLIGGKKNPLANLFDFNR